MKITFALFVATQALLLQVVSGQSIQKCVPRACPRIYAPVCDTNGKTHSNECEFKNYQCSHPRVMIAYKGECKKSGPGCEVVRCTADTHCEEVPLPCLIAPCPTRPKCVPNTPTKTTCGPTICPAVYQPVCGSNGKTYGNKCEFEGALCLDPKLTILHEGECKTPEPTKTTCGPVICQEIYQPVCGSNGKTYGNKCEFEGALCLDPSLTILYEGECKPEQTKPTCGPTICPAVYQPVCGSNGKTYGNMCALNVAACSDPSLTFAHDGECKTTGPGCDLVRCMGGYQCVESPTGAQCVPAPGSLCAATTCLTGSQCVEETLQCLVAPCPIVAKCVPNKCTKECGPFQECAVYETEEYCRDTCATGTCTKGEVCTLEEVQCVRAPCPPIAKCSTSRNCGDIACIALYDPVCGSDGKTYGNSCELGIAACYNPSLTQVSKGECGGGASEI